MEGITGFGSDLEVRTYSSSSLSKDLAKVIFGTIAVCALAVFSSSIRCFVVSDYDIQLIAEAFSAPEWVYDLGWFGQASIVFALC